MFYNEFYAIFKSTFFHRQARDFSGFYWNSSFPEKKTFKNFILEIRVKVMWKLEGCELEGAIVEMFFIMDYFPGFGKCIFSNLRVQKPTISFPLQPWWGLQETISSFGFLNIPSHACIEHHRWFRL